MDLTIEPIGKRRWAIAEGYIPEGSHGPSPEMTSHEAVCLLNAGPSAAEVRLWAFFSDREPVGPFVFHVPPRRTQHVRLNDLRAPEPIPKGREYAMLIQSDEPIVVQHTRLDSRQAENALMTTIAYSES